eukprot:7384263-Prymnesium_polylepis.1
MPPDPPPLAQRRCTASTDAPHQPVSGDGVGERAVALTERGLRRNCGSSHHGSPPAHCTRRVCPRVPGCIQHCRHTMPAGRRTVTRLGPVGQPNAHTRCFCHSVHRERALNFPTALAESTVSLTAYRLCNTGVATEALATPWRRCNGVSVWTAAVDCCGGLLRWTLCSAPPQLPPVQPSPPLYPYLLPCPYPEHTTKPRRPNI